MHHRVGLDYERFTDHLRSAREHPEEAKQHFRDALALVRGAPFSSTAIEYAWARQLGIRMCEEIGDAAHSLAQLCIEAGHYEDAVWAAEQGLDADPLAEVLIRDLMVAADATGN